MGSFIDLLGGRRPGNIRPACMTISAGAGAVVRLAALGAVPLPFVEAEAVMTTVPAYPVHGDVGWGVRELIALR